VNLSDKPATWDCKPWDHVTKSTQLKNVIPFLLFFYFYHYVILLFC
jgi:hypothetical protein